MVTRTVIRITPSEASTPASAAKAKALSAEGPINDYTPSTKQINIPTHHPKQKPQLCNHPDCTKRAQHPSPLCWMHGAKDSICSFVGCNNRGILLGLCPEHGGLVQLCHHRGCINEVNFKKRGGLCRMHQVGPMDGEQSDSEDDDSGEIRLCCFRGCISDATTADGLCDRHSAHNCTPFNEGGKKHLALPRKRKRQHNSFVIDLSDVPPQPPVPKSDGYIKEGASKYTGVSFRKQGNDWVAQIMIEGKQRCIGYYENEEEAAVDYARAVYKYKGQGTRDKAREQKSQLLVIDLSDVPPQPPVPKSDSYIKEGASKYKGVSFNKQVNKWRAHSSIEGKQRCIGYYENEEEAAVDYARAVYKYKGQGTRDKAKEQKSQSLVIDLSDVPPQQPIPKSKGRRGGESKYTGVVLHRKSNRWEAKIMIDRKHYKIGLYGNEEEAAIDYARAIFKYKASMSVD